MGKRLNKLKSLLNRTYEYIIRRARSDTYYDHVLVDKIKYRYDLRKQFNNPPEDIIPIEHLPVGDMMVGRNGKHIRAKEVLQYPHNALFLRSRKGKMIAVYTLKKKSDVHGYLVSGEMSPIEVKIL